MIRSKIMWKKSLSYAIVYIEVRRLENRRCLFTLNCFSGDKKCPEYLEIFTQDPAFKAVKSKQEIPLTRK